MAIKDQVVTGVCPYCKKEHEATLNEIGFVRIFCPCGATGRYGKLLNSPTIDWFWLLPQKIGPHP